MFACHISSLHTTNKKNVSSAFQTRAHPRGSIVEPQCLHQDDLNSVLQRFKDTNYQSWPTVKLVQSSPYSHIWSLFAQIHMKSWPNVKLCQVGVVLILPNITHLAFRKSYLAIIGPNSYEKLTKYELCKVIICTYLVYLPSFAPIFVYI